MKKRICIHEKQVDKQAILWRCACGNVWMNGEFFGSVPQDQGAVAVLGAFSRGPSK